MLWMVFIWLTNIDGTFLGLGVLFTGYEVVKTNTEFLNLAECDRTIYWGFLWRHLHFKGPDPTKKKSRALVFSKLAREAFQLDNKYSVWIQTVTVRTAHPIIA